jgi:3-hydroxypropanoate dehydrogenase
MNDGMLNKVFLDARSANGFLPKPVSAELLRDVYNLAKMGPTSMNTQPARYLFLASSEAKEKLMPALLPGNVDKTKSAPVTVVVATDTRFFENMPTTWHVEGAEAKFSNNPELAQSTAFRNGTLGGAYFMMAARALGLDCGPISGFDIEKCNAIFFPDGRFKTNFLINLGFADHTKTFPRNRRLDFEEACRIA